MGRVALFEQPVRYLDEMAHFGDALRDSPLQADEATAGGRRSVLRNC